MKRALARKLRTKLMFGLAVAVVLAATTTAVVLAAQSGAHHHKASALASAAGYLGVSRAQLKSELRSGKSLAQIAGATSGRSSAGLLQALEATAREKLAAAAAKLQARVTAQVDRVGGPATLRARVRTLALAAGYLGASATQLRAELRAGKTLAQIAKRSAGRSEAGLIEALVAARRTALAAAVKNGTITKARADAALPKLLRHVTAQVNRVQRKRGSSARG